MMDLMKEQHILNKIMFLMDRECLQNLMVPNMMVNGILDILMEKELLLILTKVNTGEVTIWVKEKDKELIFVQMIILIKDNGIKEKWMVKDY